VNINGTPSLACHERIRDALGADGEITVEPLPHFRPVRDLDEQVDRLAWLCRIIAGWQSSIW